VLEKENSELKTKLEKGPFFLMGKAKLQKYMENGGVSSSDDSEEDTLDPVF